MSRHSRKDIADLKKFGFDPQMQAATFRYINMLQKLDKPSRHDALDLLTSRLDPKINNELSRIALADRRRVAYP